jgi:hypothetical protein
LPSAPAPTRSPDRRPGRCGRSEKNGLSDGRVARDGRNRITEPRTAARSAASGFPAQTGFHFSGFLIEGDREQPESPERYKEVFKMAKSQDVKKDVKKKAQKSLKEKRAEKKSKKDKS